MLYDTVRGVTKYLVSNDTDAEATDVNSLTSFDSDGVTLGSAGSSNATGVTSVAWNWKGGGTAASNTDGTITSSVSANPTAGFSVLTYTGTGSNATVGHGLSSAPAMVIVKGRTASGSGHSDYWFVYAEPMTVTNVLLLDTTGAAYTGGSAVWNSTAPTSSVFSIDSDTTTNESGRAYVAYCFSNIEGYSKVGSYTGNGNNDGTFVYTGFRPMWVMAKCSNASASWLMTDSVRFPYNVTQKPLFANETSAETDSSTYAIDILSNGFKCRGVNNNTNNSSGDTYIYLAFAESPFKTSNAR